MGLGGWYLLAAGVTTMVELQVALRDPHVSSTAAAGVYATMMGSMWPLTACLYVGDAVSKFRMRRRFR